MPADQSAVGCFGELIVATRGSAGPGEVLVKMRGGTEAYLAWSEEPLPRGTTVLVFNSRGGRTVDVMQWSDPLEGPTGKRRGATVIKGEVMLGYRVPAPDEAMLVSGGKAGRDGTPFRVVTGHGAFVMPFFRQVRFLTLAMRESEVAEQCVTTQGISLQVRAVIAFKVGNDAESIVNAGQRFLSDQDQMAVLTGGSSLATFARSSAR